MIKQKSKPKGFIAIVSLLIVATVAMFFSMSMLLDGVNNASLSLNSLFYEGANINATACAEDALIRIKKEEQFNRNLNYTISDDNTCSSSIQWFQENPVAFGITERLANLDVTGVSNGFTRSFRYELRVLKYDVNHADGTLEHMKTINFTSINELTS